MKIGQKVRVVSATEAKNRFGEIIKHAYALDAHLVIEKSGIPVVAIIPIADYQRFIGAEPNTPEIAQKIENASERQIAIHELERFLTKAHATMSEVDEEDADRLVRQAVKQIRAERARTVIREPRVGYSTSRRSRKSK